MNIEEKLPVRLGKSPLVEALFEMRFTSHLPASSILSGHLYTQLGCTEIIRLPHADIPDQLRQMDPNLAYMPVIRLKWNNFFISLGDRSIIISNPHPYSGWSRFSSAINTILETAAQANIFDICERFSLKYIDIFDMPGFSSEGNGFNLSIKLPAAKINPATTHARFEIKENPWLHIIQYFGEAHGNLPDGTAKKGVMVDVDTIEQFDNKPFKDFFHEFKERLDALHSKNKALFFKVISKDGLQALEPTYE